MTPSPPAAADGARRSAVRGGDAIPPRQRHRHGRSGTASSGPKSGSYQKRCSSALAARECSRARVVQSAAAAKGPSPRALRLPLLYRGTQQRPSSFASRSASGRCGDSSYEQPVVFTSAEKAESLFRTFDADEDSRLKFEELRAFLSAVAEKDWADRARYEEWCQLLTSDVTSGLDLASFCRLFSLEPTFIGDAFRSLGLEALGGRANSAPPPTLRAELLRRALDGGLAVAEVLAGSWPTDFVRMAAAELSSSAAVALRGHDTPLRLAAAAGAQQAAFAAPREALLTLLSVAHDFVDATVDAAERWHCCFQGYLRRGTFDQCVEEWAVFDATWGAKIAGLVARCRGVEVLRRGVASVGSEEVEAEAVWRYIRAIAQLMLAVEAARPNGLVVPASQLAALDAAARQAQAPFTGDCAPAQAPVVKRVPRHKIHFKSAPSTPVNQAAKTIERARSVDVDRPRSGDRPAKKALSSLAVLSPASGGRPPAPTPSGGELRPPPLARHGLAKRVNEAGGGDLRPTPPAGRQEPTAAAEPLPAPLPAASAAATAGGVDAAVPAEEEGAAEEPMAAAEPLPPPLPAASIAAAAGSAGDAVPAAEEPTAVEESPPPPPPAAPAAAEVGAADAAPVEEEGATEADGGDGVEPAAPPPPATLPERRPGTTNLRRGSGGSQRAGDGLASSEASYDMDFDSEASFDDGVASCRGDPSPTTGVATAPAELAAVAEPWGLGGEVLSTVLEGSGSLEQAGVPEEGADGEGDGEGGSRSGSLASSLEAVEGGVGAGAAADEAQGAESSPCGGDDGSVSGRSAESTYELDLSGEFLSAMSPRWADCETSAESRRASLCAESSRASLRAESESSRAESRAASAGQAESGEFDESVRQSQLPPRGEEAPSEEARAEASPPSARSYLRDPRDHARSVSNEI